MKPPIIVQKYGGSSVATTSDIKYVAQLIKERCDKGSRLCVVVSAMGKTTDQLLALAKEISPSPSRRELDMLLTCGERSSMALLAMALEDIGVPSVSLTGSQSGIITDDQHSGAKIIEVRPTRVLEALERGKVVIIAGFQGVSLQKEITTLGRGGSDTTAVAMAVALNAESCEIYSDVAGVYSADPRLVPDAKLIESIAYPEMEELAQAGAKVLNAQAVEFAKRNNIVIRACKTGEGPSGTIISANPTNSSNGLLAIAHKEEALLFGFPNWQSYLSAKALMAQHGIKPAIEMGDTQISCVLYPEDAHEFPRFQKAAQDMIVHPNIGLVSLVGHNAGAGSELMLKACEILGKQGWAVKGVVANPLRTTFFLEPKHVKDAVHALHASLSRF